MTPPPARATPPAATHRPPPPATSLASRQRKVTRSMAETANNRLQWLSQRVDQLAGKMDDLALRLERLPTREELTAQLVSKVDVPSYQIAHRAMESAVTQHQEQLGSQSRAIQATNDFFQGELHKSVTERQLLRDQVGELRRDVDQLQSAPQTFRTSATFYVLIAGVVLSALCSGISILVSVLTALLHGGL